MACPKMGRNSVREHGCRQTSSYVLRETSKIKQRYRSASILKNRRVVFDIQGNDFRLVVSVAYWYQAVHAKFIGTHKEYDDIDADHDREAP